MVVVNNNDKDETLDLKHFSEAIKSSIKGKDIISGKEISLQNNLIVPAKTSMIIELN